MKVKVKGKPRSMLNNRGPNKSSIYTGFTRCYNLNLFLSTFFPVLFPVIISAPNWLICPPGSKPMGSSGHHPDRVRIQVRPDQNQSTMTVWVWTVSGIILSQSTMEIWTIPHPLVKYKIVYPVYCNIFKIQFMVFVVSTWDRNTRTNNG